MIIKQEHGAYDPKKRGDLSIILAVSGGVAAYKSAILVSALKQKGYDIQVFMSQAAEAFVTPLTFAALTQQDVICNDDFLDPKKTGLSLKMIYPHLFPATQSDLFILAPASANRIAKIAHGIGDDILGASVLALSTACRRYFCPAMNDEMWRQDVVQDNCRILEERGWRRIGPEDGIQACGSNGSGRMSEAEKILEIIYADIENAQRLRGQNVLILSGPTVEHFDPVRYLSNASSGKMGKALALSVVAAGATVDFISGPVPQSNLPNSSKITLHSVHSSTEMLEAAEKYFDSATIVIFVAAIADYMPSNPSREKLAKISSMINLHLTLTPDIAARLGIKKRPDQICVGFALETQDALPSAQKKLQHKQFDAIILNGVESFGEDKADFSYLSIKTPDTLLSWPAISKDCCAARIVDKIVQLQREKRYVDDIDSER